MAFSSKSERRSRLRPFPNERASLQLKLDTDVVHGFSADNVEEIDSNRLKTLLQRYREELALLKEDSSMKTKKIEKLEEELHDIKKRRKTAVQAILPYSNLWKESQKALQASADDSSQPLG